VDVDDPRRPPLHGIRVLDLTGLMPGALATWQLADLGAVAMKPEVPPRATTSGRRRPT
jgi:crotonobetainyl-CoA:carnitine CoA-transferase CaiB-like acyl-CoA transferase